MRLVKVLMGAATVLAMTVPAMADPGDILVRIRGVGVVPDVSDNFAPIKVSADSQIVPEIDGTYFLTNNIALELIAATTKHIVHETGIPGIPSNSMLGSVWLLPPTLTVQYHFAPQGTSFRPYVGAGLNYTFMYSASDSGALSPAHLSYGDNFGYAVQACADIPFGTQGFFLNVDMKKIFLSTTVKLAGAKLGNANLDPWLIGLGIGVKL
jgi:outer membrane protein